MQIDWFTFGAQVVNFVLLVYLLKRFLYRPVLGAIEAREERVRGRLEDARKREEAAETEADRYRALQEELEGTRAEVLRRLDEEADARRRELSAQVREEAEGMRREWRDSIRRQKDTFLDQLRAMLTAGVRTLAARVLADLADVELEKQVLRVFLRRLRQMPPEERADFVSALQADQFVQLRSAFPLPDRAREEIGEVLSDWTGGEVEIRCRHDPALPMGIELQTGDRKLAWSVESYLDAVEEEMVGLIDAEAG